MLLEKQQPRSVVSFRVLRVTPWVGGGHKEPALRAAVREHGLRKLAVIAGVRAYGGLLYRRGRSPAPLAGGEFAARAHRGFRTRSRSGCPYKHGTRPVARRGIRPGPRKLGRVGRAWRLPERSIPLCTTRQLFGARPEWWTLSEESRIAREANRAVSEES